jgi:hypothetical protein
MSQTVRRNNSCTALVKRDSVKVRDLVEVPLLYVGVPAVTLCPLGSIWLLIRLWRDNLFPYNDYDTVWSAVAMTPTTWSSAPASSYCTFPWFYPPGYRRCFVDLEVLRKPRSAGEERRGRRGWWGPYLLVVLPAAAFLAYHCV